MTNACLSLQRATILKSHVNVNPLNALTGTVKSIRGVFIRQDTFKIKAAE